jgi:hypothetical protein
MKQDEQVREVYAHFGLAVYMAQVLEHALVNAMVVGRLPQRARVTGSEIDDFMSEQFDATLGKLIKELGHYMVVPEALAGALQRALRTRNWLAHRYFREHAVEFMSEAGRSATITELQDARNSFEAADQLLETVVQPIMARYGITDQTVAEYERRLRVGEIGG